MPSSRRPLAGLLPLFHASLTPVFGRSRIAETDKALSGSIPGLFERHFVPLIFEPHAREAAVQIREIAPKSVLEIAAGTGVVTRRRAAELPATTRLVVSDLHESMIAVSRSRAPQDWSVEWRQADALSFIGVAP